MPDLLDAAEDEVADDPWRTANLREMRRRWVHATALDGDLIAAMARADSECEMAWREARQADDYETVKPYLQTVLDLVRRAGEARAEALGCSVYEALMDVYEPGARTERIDALFDDIAAFLPGFLDRVLRAQAGEPPPIPMEGPFPVEAQRALGERLMVQLGFDFEAGRLDVSLHPFCSGVPGDIRVTTRYDAADFTQSVMAVLHETGHALYNAGLPPEWRRQPVGSARGMATHESQSLLIEMQACRSAEFIGFLAPMVREAFGGTGPAWSADNLCRHYRQVARSLIRVDADEVTYPAHVILRYRLERSLIEGSLSLDDLPEAWADGLDAVLGIRPPDDASSCLQDIHWYSGTWGYFPTYALGALAAAQLFEAAEDGQTWNTRGAIARGLCAAARLASGIRPSKGLDAGLERRSPPRGDRRAARYRVLQAPPGDALPVRSIEARRRFPSCRRQGCPRRWTGGRGPRSRAGAPEPWRRSPRSGCRGSRNWRSRRARRS